MKDVHFTLMSLQNMHLGTHLSTYKLSSPLFFSPLYLYLIYFYMQLTRDDIKQPVILGIFFVFTF